MGGASVIAMPARLAFAQSCSDGYLYCSAGWCCPPGPGGSTEVCCNSNPESTGCTSNGICSGGSSGNSSGGSSGNSSGGSSGNSSGGTCTTTGSGSCTLEACVSSDSQTCSYTLNGSAVCSAACSNFSGCEDQAGEALSNCEGGGSGSSSGGCDVAEGPSGASLASGVGLLLALGLSACGRRARKARGRAVQ